MHFQPDSCSRFEQAASGKTPWLAWLGFLLHFGINHAISGEATQQLADLALEDFLKVEVSSASKFTQNAQQAPSAVQVIEASDIRRHGWRTLAEALNSLPGVYSVNDRVYDYIGARGFLVPGDYNTRFLLLLDGQRLNDNIYQQAAFSHDFPLDMALVERIEYIPGPGSSIYGSNAVFGVINVITRKAKSLAGLETGLHVSSDGWRETRVTGSHFGAGEGPDIVASFSHGIKDGQNLRYPAGAGLSMADGTPSPDGMTHGLDRSTVSRAFLSIAQGGFSTSAWAAQRHVNPSSALYGSNFDDGRLRIADGSYGLRSSYHLALNEHWQVDSRLALQKMTYDADYPYYNAPTSYVNRDNTIGSWWSGEARLLYSGFRQHKLIAGIEFSADRQARQKNADVDVAVNTPLDVETRGQQQGFYLQDEWNFAAGWRLNAGLRHDHFSNGRANTSPRLGLIWEASERTTFKLLSGQAYRLANAYETSYTNNIDSLANTSLKPEAIRTLEAVGEFRLQPGVMLGASLYDYRINHLIRQIDTGGGVLQYQNQPEIAAHGLELHYHQRHGNGSNLLASLAFNRTEDANGQWLNNSPRWIAKLRGSQPVYGDRLLAALEMNAMGRRSTEWQGSRSDLGMQWVLNAALTATRLAPGLEAQLRVINLFDRSIQYPASDEAPVSRIPVGGRRLQIGLTYAF